MCKFALCETLLYKSLPVSLASYMLAGEEDVPLRGSSTFLENICVRQCILHVWQNDCL